MCLVCSVPNIGITLEYMVRYPVWSTCGLKYGNEKYICIFTAMDTDLHSGHTLNTEFCLSAMQRLLTHSEPVAMVTHIKEKSLGNWDYFLFSLSRVSSLRTPLFNCLKF